MFFLVAWVPVESQAVDSDGWVSGNNIFDQWQNQNGFFDQANKTQNGNSHQQFNMWGGAGAQVYDPASYRSDLVQGQSSNIFHNIDGGNFNHELSKIQRGMMDFVAHPGQIKDFSVGGTNDTYNNFRANFDKWEDYGKYHQSSGVSMSAGGSVGIDMRGHVRGVAPGDRASYDSEIYQGLGYDLTTPIAGGHASSFLRSNQAGKIDVKP